MGIPKFEIIVPVYKVEQYLRKCIDSLINQDYDDYHITLVDDGSPDNCGNICDEYVKIYPDKITALHKSNGGLSDARNYGVANTKSEYVIFVDSDDWVGNGFVSSLNKGLVSDDVDMVVAPFYRELIDDKGMSIISKPYIAAVCLMDNREAFSEMCREKLFGCHACGKAIRRSIVAKHPYPKGKLFEDAYTTYKHVLDSRKISYVPLPTYYYLQRQGGIVRSHFSEKHMGIVYAPLEMIEYVKTHGYDDLVSISVYKLYRNSHSALVRAYEDDGFEKIYKEIRTLIKLHYPHLKAIPQSSIEKITHNSMIHSRRLYKTYLCFRKIK